jgi:signal transduction histidine kinase
MRSLSRTLIVGTTLGTVAVLVVSGCALYVLVRTSLISQLDRSLLDKAYLLASTVEEDNGSLDLEFTDLDMREFEGKQAAACLQLWSSDGATIFKSQSGGQFDLADGRKKLDAPECSFVRLPDHRRGRGVHLSFFPRPEQTGENPKATAAVAAAPVSLAIARSTREIDQVLGTLRLFLLSVGAVAVGTAAGLLRWLVKRSLRPLETLTLEIAGLDENDLHKVVGRDGSCPREIQPVVDRLNDLLRRLDNAFRRERAFSANVAHELRNPLTGLRLKMDVATSKTRDPSQYEQAIDDCREITGQMESMVENLLSLARLEAEQVHVRCEPLCLYQLVQDTWAPLIVEADHRALDVHWSPERKIEIVSDASLLTVLVRNVLENAVAYANDGGSVRIDVELLNGEARFAIENSGSKISQEQAESAFDQFWRGDEARSEVGVHCGLGLSLVRKIAAVLGGTAVARSSMGGSFEMAVSIPCRTEDSDRQRSP